MTAASTETTEQFETRSKKTRGMARASIDLIEAMSAIAEEAQPITGRGVGYKLFTAGLMPSMATSDMARRPVCACRNTICRTGSRNTTVIMWCSSASPYAASI